MSFDSKVLSDADIKIIFEIEEDHFNEFKAKSVSGKGFSKAVSAFANASGGDIYLGIREERKTKIKHWEGFGSIEDANCFLQVMESISFIEQYYEIEYLKHNVLQTYVVKVSIFKTREIIETTDHKIYVRKGAQSLLVETPEQKRRLELDKGITSFEDEPVGESEIEDITKSQVYEHFAKSIVPKANPEAWITKQRLFKNGKVTVAGEMLFSDEPQICLAKRSSIKVFRYKTSGQAERDTLDGNPITIEGCAYYQISSAVEKTKEIIESLRKVGEGFESVNYPEETIHEIVTNAVLHRDYSIATDIQIRIFDNRVEIESPGKLPGHVTVDNILNSQAARNPKIVRLINKFPDPPNKDVGEGLNTAFEAMKKLRLKEPRIIEKENSVLVIIKHERLASPEEIVVEYLISNKSIKNATGRSICGIKSENTMKNVFYRLRDRGYIHLIKGFNYWVKTEQFEELAREEFPKLFLKE